MAKQLKIEGTATSEEVERVYAASQDPRDQERLLAIRMAQQGNFRLEQIGSTLNRGQSTIARWLKAYREGGIEKLLYRAHGGRSASLSRSDQDILIRGLSSGRWPTAREVQAWLKKERGVELSLPGVYYWLRRLSR